MNDFSTYILAGGKSSRFGSDKARAVVGGRAMIVGVAEELGKLGAPVTVVAAAAGQYADLGLHTIADRVAGIGPIGGIHSALCDAPGAWVAVVSCDCVGLRAAWVETLLAARRDDVDAVAFRHETWEPLLAVYRTSLRDRVETDIAGGRISPRRMLDEVRTRALPLPVDWRGVVQVNSPAELEQLERAR